MLRTVWSFIKLVIFLGVALIVAAQPGEVIVSWQDWRVTMVTPVFIILIVIFLVIIMIVYRVMLLLTDFPAFWQRRRVAQGYRALTRGLVAIAVGDGPRAARAAKIVRTCLPKADALGLLLAAQSARLNQDEVAATKHFTALVEHKDATFLGLRGLLQTALQKDETNKALDLARQALAVHPRQAWLKALVYDLLIKTSQWKEAYALAPKAVDSKRATSDRRAIMMLWAEESGDIHYLRKAYSPDFTPAVIALAARYLREGKRARAVRILEQAWRIFPHPDIVPLWRAAAPAPRKQESMTTTTVRWIARLAALNPQHEQSHIAVAQTYVEAGLWGLARETLEAITQDSPHIHLLRAHVEEGLETDSAQNWYEKARVAPPAPTWVCCLTGRTYDHWSPIATPHGAFNTIVWGKPHQDSPTMALPFAPLVAEYWK